jgi:putative ABC transport system substrate-binding protein
MNGLRSVALVGPVLGVSLAATGADVVILKSTDVPAWREAVDALRRGAPGHTYTEHDLRGDRAQALQVLKGLERRPAVLVALGPLAAQAARDGAPDTPLVFCMVPEPEKAGLVPGPGVTGVAFRIPARNQLAAFRSVNPGAVRIGILHGPESADMVAQAEKAAHAVRLSIHARALAAGEAPSRALRALLEGPDAVDALWLPAGSRLLEDPARRLLLLKEAARAGKPVYTSEPSVVDEGALVSNSPDLASVGERTAELVNRLAAGEREPIALLFPRTELTINVKAAARLKIAVPEGAQAAARAN